MKSETAKADAVGYSDRNSAAKPRAHSLPTTEAVVEEHCEGYKENNCDKIVNSTESEQAIETEKSSSLEVKVRTQCPFFYLQRNTIFPNLFFVIKKTSLSGGPLIFGQCSYPSTFPSQISKADAVKWTFHSRRGCRENSLGKRHLRQGPVFEDRRAFIFE